jgi:hypothetical protein
VLSDVVTATRDEADMIDLSSPEPLAGALLANGLDPVKLARLEGLLTGATFDELLGDLTGGYRRTVDNETWLVGVRRQLTDALASADVAGARDLAAGWAATDEWRLDRGSAASLEPIVARLISLAGEARGSGRELYLRMTP